VTLAPKVRSARGSVTHDCALFAVHTVELSCYGTRSGGGSDYVTRVRNGSKDPGKRSGIVANDEKASFDVREAFSS
jgi:hypothetical protein